MENIYESVPTTNYSKLYNEAGALNYKEIAQTYLKFNNKQVAQAAKIEADQVRFDERISKELQLRFAEWAAAIEKVASFFDGDIQKTTLWFQLPNPMLGNVSPRDMIRYGRFNRLYSFILSSIDES